MSKQGPHQNMPVMVAQWVVCLTGYQEFTSFDSCRFFQHSFVAIDDEIFSMII